MGVSQIDVAGLPLICGYWPSWENWGGGGLVQTVLPLPPIPLGSETHPLLSFFRLHPLASRTTSRAPTAQECLIRRR